MKQMEASELTVVDGPAPRHHPGARRLLVSPASVPGGSGPGTSGAVVVDRGRRDGSTTRLYAGSGLVAAAEAVESAAADAPPRAVWLTDRRYVRENWPPWTVRTVERRLADAADGANAALIAWTGSTPG